MKKKFGLLFVLTFAAILSPLGAMEEEGEVGRPCKKNKEAVK